MSRKPYTVIFSLERLVRYMRNLYRVKSLLLCVSTVLLLCACQDLTPPVNQSTTETTSMETIETDNSFETEVGKPSNVKVDAHTEMILPEADKLKWEYSTRLLANTVLLANDDVVVIQSDDAQIGGFHEYSYLMCLDAKSGESLWSIEVSFNSTVVHEDISFVLKNTGSGEYKLTAYDTKSGSQIWRSTYSKILESQQLFIVKDYLYLKVKYDENNSGLYRIDAKTGKTVEEHPIASNTYVYSNGKHLFFIDTDQAKIQSLSLKFKVLWTIDSIDCLFIDSNYEDTSRIIAYINNNLCYVDLAAGQIRKYQIENKDKADLIAYIKDSGTGSKYQYCDDFIVYDGWLSMIIGNRNYLLSTTNDQTIVSHADERIFLIGQDIIAYKNNVVTCKPLNVNNNKWELELTSDFKVMNDIASYKDMLILWGSNGYILCDSKSGCIIKQVLYKDSDGDRIEFYPRSYVFNLYKSERFLFLPRLFGLECYYLE